MKNFSVFKNGFTSLCILNLGSRLELNGHFHSQAVFSAVGKTVLIKGCLNSRAVMNAMRNRKKYFLLLPGIEPLFLFPLGRRLVL